MLPVVTSRPGSPPKGTSNAAALASPLLPARAPASLDGALRNSRPRLCSLTTRRSRYDSQPSFTLPPPAGSAVRPQTMQGSRRRLGQSVSMQTLPRPRTTFGASSRFAPERPTSPDLSYNLLDLDRARWTQRGFATSCSKRNLQTLQSCAPDVVYDVRQHFTFGGGISAAQSIMHSCSSANIPTEERFPASRAESPGPGHYSPPHIQDVLRPQSDGPSSAFASSGRRTPPMTRFRRVDWSDWAHTMKHDQKVRRSSCPASPQPTSLTGHSHRLGPPSRAATYLAQAAVWCCRGRASPARQRGSGVRHRSNGAMAGKGGQGEGD